MKNVDTVLEQHDILVAHRVFSNGKECPTLAQLSGPEIKRKIFGAKTLLRSVLSIGLTEDIPTETVIAQRTLKPILYEAKHLSTEGKKHLVKMKDDKLIVNGRAYSMKRLNQLPAELLPERVFMPRREDKMAFFTKNAPFSNHFISPFRIEGKEFLCVEQYLMYAKAILFGDETNANYVMQANDPVEHKRLGSKINHFNKQIWKKKRLNVTDTVLHAKFTQNPRLRQMLWDTGNKLIIEANPTTNFWSCGLTLCDHKVWEPKSWKGKNALGELMMKVRNDLLCN